VVVDPVVAGVHLGIADEGVGGLGVDLQQRPPQQHPGPGHQQVLAELLAGGEPGPHAGAAAVVQGRSQGPGGGEHHPGHVGGVGGQVAGRDLGAPGVAEQDHAVGVDAPADGLQVGHVAGDGVLAGSASRAERPVPTWWL
jgi:hypothetical protein